jgi:hypothetical protein
MAEPECRPRHVEQEILGRCEAALGEWRLRNLLKVRSRVRAEIRVRAADVGNQRFWKAQAENSSEEKRPAQVFRCDASARGLWRNQLEHERGRSRADRAAQRLLRDGQAWYPEASSKLRMEHRLADSGSNRYAGTGAIVQALNAEGRDISRSRQMDQHARNARQDPASVPGQGCKRSNPGQYTAWAPTGPEFSQTPHYAYQIGCMGDIIEVDPEDLAARAMLKFPMLFDEQGKPTSLTADQQKTLNDLKASFDGILVSSVTLQALTASTSPLRLAAQTLGDGSMNVLVDEGRGPPI